MAPSVSLWCRWALTSTSAGMLFIYTSYKSVSLDLQHKLCQASREITRSECVSAKKKKKKPSTRNLGAIKHFWGLNYSTRLYSNQIYSALIIAHEHNISGLHQLHYLTYKIHMSVFVMFLFWIDRFEARAFIFLSSLQFFCITLIREDMRTKTGKGFSLYCTLLHPLSVQIALHPLYPNHLCLTQILLFSFSFHVVDKLCLAVPVLDAKVLLINAFFFKTAN